MSIPESFYQLSKEQQEEEATKMANKYYREAEQWRRLAVQVRIGKVKSTYTSQQSKSQQ